MMMDWPMINTVMIHILPESLEQCITMERHQRLDAESLHLSCTLHHRNGQSHIPILIRALRHVCDVKPDVVLLNLIDVNFLAANLLKNRIKAIEKVLDNIQKLGIPMVYRSGKHTYGSRQRNGRTQNIYRL